MFVCATYNRNDYKIVVIQGSMFVHMNDYTYDGCAVPEGCEQIFKVKQDGPILTVLLRSNRRVLTGFEINLAPDNIRIHPLSYFTPLRGDFVHWIRKAYRFLLYKREIFVLLDNEKACAYLKDNTVDDEEDGGSYRYLEFPLDHVNDLEIEFLFESVVFVLNGSLYYVLVVLGQEILMPMPYCFAFRQVSDELHRRILVYNKQLEAEDDAIFEANLRL